MSSILSNRGDHWTSGLGSAHTAHLVQFYETDDFLSGAVADFIADGYLRGEPAVVIATPAHREAFVVALKERGIDPGLSIRFLDARETLDRFMNEKMPDEERFQASVGSVIREASSSNARARAYGEMVDLLWKDGNPEGALRLEELWNDLADRYGFSLLCAYSINSFYKEADGTPFDEVCRRHGHVIPAESLPISGDTHAQLLEISRLQQRAEALTAEIEHRKDLERSLREALAARRRAEEGNAFLLDATTVLSSTLEYETRLREVASLAVPRLAAVCAVDLLRDDDTCERVCIRPEGADLVTTGGPARDDVIATGEPRVAGDRSWMIVPMKIAGRVPGAITFVSEAACRYSEADLALACEFARRAAIAVENGRLYQAAQEANRAKDQFLATLSHELRTPLTAILGWARMLKLGLDPETIRVAYDTIERSATAQAAIIDDLLDIARVVTGKLTLNRELVDLGGVVDSTVQTLRFAADAKDIHIDIHGVSSDSRMVVAGDPTRLQQIAWNLLSNAIKFSEPGAHVSISLERRGDSARLAVRDNGRGISPDFLTHVFEAFRQADGANTRTHSGLGLGLAIVKYLSEAHGGTVSASCEGEGKGAEFTVTLPLASRRSMRAQPAAGDVADLSNISVLVLDDDSNTRDLVVAILRRCGAEVYAADSAASARASLESKTPDVVVSDIAMPGQDGDALISHLQSHYVGAERIPIIALTASGDPQAEESLRNAGFDGYVRKPVDPLQLVRVISELCRAQA